MRFIIMKESNIRDILDLILEEYIRATSKFPRPFSSGHEGYGVIKEELDELWDEIKQDGGKQRKKEEAVQLAAMAVRFIAELCKEDNIFH